MKLARFPRTPHLFYSSKDIARDDKKLTRRESNSVLAKEIVVQEKIDGTGIGISHNEDALPLIQDKRSLVPMQNILYAKLKDWYEVHQTEVFDVCEGDNRTLFGEWMLWKHTVPYNELPSFFIAHDIYDKRKGIFLPASVVERELKGTDIAYNKPIFRGKLSRKKGEQGIHLFNKLEGMLGKSQFGNEKMEGLYIRADSGYKNVIRCKMVDEEFRGEIGEHWRKRLFPNHTDGEKPYESDWTNKGKRVKS